MRESGITDFKLHFSQLSAVNPLLTKLSCPVSEERYYVESQFNNFGNFDLEMLKTQKTNNFDFCIIFRCFKKPKRKMFIKI